MGELVESALLRGLYPAAWYLAKLPQILTSFK
jgi:hypothetical protein